MHTRRRGGVEVFGVSRASRRLLGHSYQFLQGLELASVLNV